MCVSIQLFVLSKHALVSSSGLPAYSGLKWDQVNCGLCDTSGTTGALGIKGLKGVRDSENFHQEVDFDLGLALDPDLGFDLDFGLDAALGLLCIPLFLFIYLISF